ncbi:MAG TPA: hypothetical protein VD978_18245, partial [Azospirillum sp.]|nr:hypothetical protein [Azospirillum sp.]
RRILRVLVPPMQLIGLKVMNQVNLAAHPQTGGTPPPQWKPSSAVRIIPAQAGIQNTWQWCGLARFSGFPLSRE